jgi:TonB family protein
MSQLQLWIASYFLNSLWQIPLLFTAGWLVARTLRPAGPAMEHRLWVGILFLQSLLPACSLLPWQWLRSIQWGSGQDGHATNPQVAIALGPGSISRGLHLPGTVMVSIVVPYAAVTAWFALRFVWRSRKVTALRREAVPAAVSRHAADAYARCSRKFSIADVSLAASSRITGPVTMGVWRKLVLLPAGMADTLSHDDLRTVIAHEFAHMHRHDFLKNLFYELISLPVAYHPLLWFTRARIMESREMICDEMAAEIDGQNDYARSLLRLARMLLEGAPAITPHTIGIFDAGTFERRIMNLTRKQNQLSPYKRAGLMAAGALLALGISATALAVAVHIQPVAAADDNKSKAPKQLSVSPEDMQGNLISKAIPIYPPDAKKAKIQGKVVLSITIDKGGNVQNVTAVSGPRELQQSAIDAVRQWKYKPYLLNGDPVEVESTVNVIYQLAGPETSAKQALEKH